MKTGLPIFVVDEIIQEKFIVTEVFYTKGKGRFVSLRCLDCGATETKKEDRLSEKVDAGCSVKCKGCKKIEYQRVVAAAEAISHRVCRGCKKILPKEDFRPRLGCKNYINPWCRKCEVAKYKYPENLLDDKTGLKRCALCKQLLPRKAFARHPHPPDGLKSWCEKCNTAHYKESLIARGLKVAPSETREEKRKRKEAETKRLKEAAEKKKNQFKIDKENFFKDPHNKGRKFTIRNWEKGYYQ